MEVETDPLGITPDTRLGFLQEFTCRVCLYRDKNNTEIVGLACQELADKMYKHLSVELTVDNNSCMWICKLCDQSLKSFHAFYLKVSDIQKSLVNLLLVKEESNHDGQTFELESEIDKIERTIGFARGKKARAKSKLAVVDPVRRTSTRKRKTRVDNLTDSALESAVIDSSACKTISTKPVEESNHGASPEVEVLPITLDNTVLVLKDENVEDFSGLNKPLGSAITKEDDLSSLEDQDWVGQGFSFDVESDNDQPWQLSKSERNPQRSARSKKAKSKINEDVSDSVQNDSTKSQVSDANTQCDKSATKLRITATHGLKPKPKLEPNVHKMLRAEINAKFVEFYGITCDICEKNSRENAVPVQLIKYQSFEALCTHMRDEHDVRGYVKCCNCTMREKKRAERHMLLHTDPGSIFKCNICEKQLSSQQSFRSHILLHLPDCERPFQCDVCDRGFVTKADLTQHERQHLPEEKRLSYTCDICGSRFTTDTGLLSHKQRVHENIRPHLCDLCAKSFTSRCEMERHRAHIHGDVKREQCPECGKWFKGPQILRTHMRQHKGQIFKCQYCDKTYTVRTSWKAHLLKHSDDKPHKCPICEKTFKLPGTLKAHLNQHTGELPYSCPFCPKKFASSGNYYTHRKRMHSDEVAQLKEATAAALAANGLPPPSTSAPKPKQSISEVIARTKEKVAAKAKENGNIPLPQLLQPLSRGGENINIMETSIILPPGTTILPDSNGVVGAPTFSLPNAINLPQGSNENLLVTRTERIGSTDAIPVAINSVTAAASSMHVEPTVKKISNISQFGPGTLKLIRVIAPDGTEKLLFVKQDQSNSTTIPLVRKEIVLNGQQQQMCSEDPKENANVLSVTSVG